VSYAWISSSCGCPSPLLSCRAGYADRTESARAGQRPADGIDHGVLYRGRMRLTASSGGQRTLRYRAMPYRYGTRDFERPTVGGAEQHVDLCADGHSADHRCYPASRQCDVRLS
jgi:hypothetical protein